MNAGVRSEDEKNCGTVKEVDDEPEGGSFEEEEFDPDAPRSFTGYRDGVSPRDASQRYQRKSTIKLNDDVVIEDAQLDQEQFQEYSGTPSAVSRPEQGVFLSQNTRMHGDKLAPNNYSRISKEDSGPLGSLAGRNPRRRSVDESAQIVDDDAPGQPILTHGALSTGLQKDQVEAGSVLDRSYLDRLSDSGVGLVGLGLKGKTRSSVLESRHRLQVAERFFQANELARGGRSSPLQGIPEEDLNPEQAVKRSYLEYVEMERVLSVEALRTHIWRNHPKKMDEEEEEYRDWSICQNVGSLFANACCTKRKITNFTKSLGLGPSLFLLSLKSYMRLFLALSILCVPICILLSSGTQGDSLDLGGGATALFSRVSLGNLGYQSSFACNHINLATLDTDLALVCPVGKISRLVAVGLLRETDQEVCTSADGLRQTAVITDDGPKILGEDGLTADGLASDAPILQYFIDFNEACSTYLNEELRRSQALSYLTKTFQQTCVGQAKCNLDFDYRGLDTACLKEVLRRAFASQRDELVKKILAQDDADGDRAMVDWYLELPEVAAQAEGEQFTIAPDENVPEPLLYLIAQCDNQRLKLNYFDMELTKSELNQSLVFSDIILTTLFIIGFTVISLMQRDLSREYDAHSVEARDFTLVIDGLPVSLQQNCDELSLKQAVWQQMQAAIRDSVAKGLCPGDVDPRIALISVVRGGRQLELLDLQRKIKEEVEQMVVGHATLLGVRDGKWPKWKESETAKTEARLKGRAEALQAMVEEYKTQREQLGEEEKVEFAEDEIAPEDEAKVQQKAQDFQQSVARVYVTFVSMKAKLVVEHALRMKNYKKVLRLPEPRGKEARKDGAGQQAPQGEGQQEADKKEEEPGELKEPSESVRHGPLYLREDEQKVHFLGAAPTVKDDGISARAASYDPDNIIWGHFDRRDRRLKFFLLGLLCEVICVVVTSYTIQGSIKAFQGDYMKATFNPEQNMFANRTVQCPRNFTIAEAYKDATAAKEFQNVQVITCFCRQQYEALSLSDFLSIDLNEYGASIGESTSGALPNYCAEWFQYYFYQKAQAVGPSLICVGLLNLLGVPLAFLTVKAYRFVSKDSAALKWFGLNYYLSLLNIGIILPFYSQDAQAGEGRGTITMFDRKWYMNVSSSVGLAILMQFVIYYVFIIARCLGVLGKRFWDRSWKWSIARVKEDPEDEEEEELAESKQATQAQLNELYTGDKFDAAFVQAQVLTVLSICIMFCGSMPLLYPAAFLFLCFFFWFNKWALLKWNQQAADYNERLILVSYDLLVLPILLHLVLTMYMLRLSPMLRALSYPSKDFESETTPAEQSAHLQEYPEELQHYVTFMVIVLTLYFLYVCVGSASAFLVREGYCMLVTEGGRASRSRRPRSQRYLVGESRNGEAPDGQAAARMDERLQQRLSLEGSPLSTISGASSARAGGFDRAAKPSLKLLWGADRRASTGDQYLQRQIASRNYFAEVSFNTLHFMLRQTTELAIDCKKRISLYSRIAAVDDGSELQKVFAARQAGFEQFFAELMENKARIEAEAEFYWAYVQRHFELALNDGLREGGAAGPGDGRRFEDLGRSGRSSKAFDKVLASMRSSGADFVVHREGGAEEPAAPEEGDAANNSEQVEVEAQDQATKDFNKAANQALRQNMNQIRASDKKDEEAMRDSVAVPLARLSYLATAYEEEMLHQHGLPGRLRCQSRVQSYHILDSLEYRGVGEQSAPGSGSRPRSPAIDDLFCKIIEAAGTLSKEPDLLVGLAEAAAPASEAPAEKAAQRQRLNALDQLDQDSQVNGGAQNQDRASRVNGKAALEDAGQPTSVTHRTDQQLLTTQQREGDAPEDATVLNAQSAAQDLVNVRQNSRYNQIELNAKNLADRDGLFLNDSRFSRGAPRDINATGIFPAQNDSYHLDI